MAAQPRPAPNVLVDRVLNVVERAGNRLPDPAVLFVLGLVLVWIISWFLAGTAFSIPTKEGPQVRVVVNELASAQLIAFLTAMPSTFTSFPPLGMVLVALLGVGVAERSGLVAALLRRLVEITPDRLLTPMIVFVGTVAHSASDAGFVLVVPMAGIVFYACGRHPLAGIAAAFAGVAGGFAANPLPSAIDPLLQGLTQSAVHLIDKSRSVNPLCNWYFTSTSSVIVTLVGWWVTDRVIEPRVATMPLDGDSVRAAADRDPAATATDHGPAATRSALSARERHALRIALAAFLVGIALLVTASVPADSPFRAPTGELASVEAPLMRSIVPLIFLLFLIPGALYGWLAGVFTQQKHVVDAMSSTMADMGYYLVMSFFAAQFIHVFNHSQLGALLAVRGAEFIHWMGAPIPLTLVAIIVLAGIVNLVIGSASAKWALLAPILVPMLMQAGISPEATQASYRIGDSLTNPLTPLMVYFPLIVTYCQRWCKSTGIGTLTAIMLPYSVGLAGLWTLYFLAFYFLGIPLGLHGGFTYP